MAARKKLILRCPKCNSSLRVATGYKKVFVCTNKKCNTGFFQLAKKRKAAHKNSR